MMRLFLGGAIVALIAGGGLAGCSDSVNGTGTPATVTCENSGDCASNEACVDLGNGTKGCEEAECGCISCEPCAEGLVCSNGACIPEGGSGTCDDPVCPGDPCVDDSQCDTATEFCHEGSCWPLGTCFSEGDCPDGQICENMSCRPCVGEECATTGGDCTTDGCPEGKVCNPETLACDDEVVTPGDGDQCVTCDTAADCAEGWQCVPVGGAQACLRPCTGGGECETGWNCFSGVCTPNSFSCTGCALDGCGAGLTCNMQTGECVALATDICDDCTYDWECGDGRACHKLGATRVCLDRCDGGAGCPAGNCVVNSDSGYSVCEPAQGCGVDPTECTPACTGDLPYCVNGGCVECITDADCDTSCNVALGVCETTGECVAPTPYFNSTLGKCVQCLNNTQCGNGSCNTATGVCEGDVCATCVDPYPACALVGGDYYCVQCTDDSYCGTGGTCNLETYSCEGGTVIPGDACESDADCDPGITGFDLACDVDSGLCYDKGGACDDVTAYCVGGYDCLSFFEAFGGGTFPDIPLPGGGGSTVAGVCECTPGIPFIDPQGSCPEGTQCLDLEAIFTLLGGGTSPGIGGTFCTSLFAQ